MVQVEAKVPLSVRKVSQVKVDIKGKNIPGGQWEEEHEVLKKVTNPDPSPVHSP